MTDQRKRDRHETQAEAFLVGWIPALGLGLYLGASGNGSWAALAAIGGIVLMALWYHVY